MRRHGMKRASAGNRGGGGDGRLLFFDTFTDATNTYLPDHTPNIDVNPNGWEWAQLQGTLCPYYIAYNPSFFDHALYKYVPQNTHASGYAPIALATGKSDNIRLSVDFIYNPAGAELYPCIMFRGSPDGNQTFSFARVMKTGAFNVYYWNNGFTSILAGILPAMTNGESYNMAVELEGTTIRIYWQNALFKTITNYTNNLNEGHHGLTAFQANNAWPRWDNFRIETSERTQIFKEDFEAGVSAGWFDIEGSPTLVQSPTYSYAGSYGGLVTASGWATKAHPITPIKRTDGRIRAGGWVYFESHKPPIIPSLALYGAGGANDYYHIAYNNSGDGTVYLYSPYFGIFTLGNIGVRVGWHYLSLEIDGDTLHGSVLSSGQSFLVAGSKVDTSISEFTDVGIRGQATYNHYWDDITVETF